MHVHVAMATDHEGGGAADQRFLTLLIYFFFVPLLSFILLYLFLSRHPRYGRNRGAVAYPFIGTFIVFLKNRHRILDFATELLRSDASLTTASFRPGIKVIDTANPQNIQHFLWRNFKNYPKGSYFKTVMDDLLGDGIFNVDGELWRIQRKVAAHEFTTGSLRDFTVECVKKEIESRLLPTLQHFVQSGASFDLQMLFRRFSFDAICQLSFGVNPACLHHSLPTVKFAEAFDEATNIIAGRYLAIHPLVWKIKRALNFGSERRLREAIRVVGEFAMDTIRSRRKEVKAEEGGLKEGKARLDLLSRFMNCIEQPEIIQDLAKNIPQNFDRDKFLKDVIISLLLAGIDTSSAGLSWFFWVLCTHSHVTQRCYDEIKNVLDQRGSAEPQQDALYLSYSELKELHYLQAAISESLRLYPPVPLNLKVSLEEDVWPDGTKVGNNVQVIYHSYAMGWMESIWGKDCLEFKPERWLKDGVFVAENPYKFAVFQAGPRICLGKDMAMIQMKYVAASIIFNFTIKLADPDFMKPKLSFSLTLKMVDGLHVAASNRSTHLQQAATFASFGA